ncbi:two-component system, CitB family, response regulator CitT [Salsuginibacillus halophilus]|uniref:Two-component system, CitB family, response regulator CitT n=1 Tax=Salsuginibacillus halophilus TaxID=517424 RepID=A0A2P8H965_9BACI|nr:response regulator [Salsuginibacillus halophilus]PSL42773.1 two-component system, CitB family, response regulator CitT [Salsuginibacillus halophilus]
MVNERINVLIVEDDFRVADINQAFVQAVEGFQVFSQAKTAVEAREKLQLYGSKIDVVLLDVYLPDVKGLEFLWELRQSYQQVDVIMLTASKETDIIQEALRAGIFDYIMKPLNQDRIEKALHAYALSRKAMKEKTSLEQQELDKLMGKAFTTSPSVGAEEELNLPKGIDPLTLRNVQEALADAGHVGTTAVKVAEQIGASRSTARRYLEYLIGTGSAKVSVTYGDVGRPERRYIIVS